LTRPIRWDLIQQQYDLMVKYATAIRLGTASTEALLRRFTTSTTHPAYAAMLEVGRAHGRSSWPAGCATETCSRRLSRR
jgi:TnpA family transposase